MDLSHASQPANDSERLLFRNLLPTLLRVDCAGDPRSGVVESWTTDSLGAWTLTLGDPSPGGSTRSISAAAVARGLAKSGAAKAPGIDSAVVLNDRQIRLFTTLNQEAVLRALADPTLAPLDSPGTQPSGPGEMLVMPATGDKPVIQLRLPPLGDVRDALDRGADLIVTRDPALLEYAARRSAFTVHPLPWSRTYVLVQPAPAQPFAAVTTEPERQSLARDAVHADARAAEPPFWWMESPCLNTGAPAAAGTSDRIVYPQDDEVARALAERLVALAGPGNRLRAAGLDQSQLASALRQGTERAYVVSLPRNPLLPCRELRDLPAGARIRPLIDSRAHAIVRHGAPPLSVDWDGTIRVVRP